MRKLVFFITLLCNVALAMGQNNYQRILSEGKSWVCATVSAYNRTDTIGSFCLQVGSDTIVNNRRCTKVLFNNKLWEVVGHDSVMVAYEEDGKVYRLDSDGKIDMLLDVGLHNGESIDDCTTVLKEYYITVNGVKRKRLMIDSGVDHTDGEWLYYVVEGIGANKDEFLESGFTHTSGQYNCIKACYENGICVFSNKDFTCEDSTGIPVIESKVNTTDKCFDLSGRCIVAGSTKGIYIRNRCKFLCH